MRCTLINAWRAHFAVYFIFTCQPVWASLKCAELFGKNKLLIAKGAEVEWQPVRSNIERKNTHPMIEGMAFPFSRETTDFNRMKLGDLFCLYGRDERSGKLQENLLPRVVTDHPKFKELLNPPFIPYPDVPSIHPSEWLPSERKDYEDYMRKYREVRLPFETRQDGNRYYITGFSRLGGENLKRTLKFFLILRGRPPKISSLKKDLRRGWTRRRQRIF